MKGELTELQERIYNYLLDTIREKGYPPSVREIASAVGLTSPSSAQLRLNELIEMGYISRDTDARRGIRINDDQFNLSLRKTINAPILKDYSDVESLFLPDNILGHMPILEEIISNNECFMITFKGNDLVKAAILDGDKIIIGKQETAEDGNLVMACANNSVMIRRLFKESHGYKLQTETKPIETTFVERLKIIGKVIAVFRKI